MGDTGSRALVWRQFPSAGTRVAYGSVVRLQLRVGLPPKDPDLDPDDPRRPARDV